MSDPKLLTIDIETSPLVAHVWGLWKQTVSLNQLMESTEMISFAAKWHGKPTTYFYSSFHNGKERMVQAAYDLLGEADAVIHYNGTSFDMPHLRREFLLAGLPPHKPVEEIDLLKVARGRFNFPSNKLQYVSQAVGLKGKAQHEGHTLWVKCMAGDEQAWAQMKKYNRQDVILTEQLYDVLRPWITGHPHMGLFTDHDGEVCQRCGSANLVKQGFKHTLTSSYQQYQCRDCGSWSRGAKSVDRVGARGTQ